MNSLSILQIAARETASLYTLDNSKTLTQCQQISKNCSDCSSIPVASTLRRLPHLLLPFHIPSLLHFPHFPQHPHWRHLKHTVEYTRRPLGRALVSVSHSHSQLHIGVTRVDPSSNKTQSQTRCAPNSKTQSKRMLKNFSNKK